MSIRVNYVTGRISFVQALVELRQSGVESTKCIDEVNGWVKDKEAYEVCTDLAREDCTGCSYMRTGNCPEVQ